MIPQRPSVCLPLPWRDPLTVFAPSACLPGAVLLMGGDWAIAGLVPSQVITGGFSVLAEVLAARRGAAAPAFGPFAGGVIGYWGYELAHQVERLPSPLPAGVTLPDMGLGVFDAAVVFDVRRRQAAVVAGGASAMATGGTATARQQADDLVVRYHTAPELPAIPQWAETAWTPVWDRADYEARVQRVLDYIYAGDIFQANLAQRFVARRPSAMTAFDLFRRLCRDNPAPFASFIAVDADRAVVSASPERFLRLDVAADGRRWVETRPIKGTRPRGRTPEQDRALAEDLRTSPKDRAENLMIVDLLRNDLSRTAQIGSVAVPELWQVETFPPLHHLVSVVTAEPRPEVPAWEILRQAFPGGSITGAPKVRAMEIIHELEQARRGPYCGAIGWISDHGAMDTAIAIRTLLVDGDTLSLSAGGGIVADSVPAAEYRETLVKAAPLLRAAGADPAFLREEGV